MRLFAGDDWAEDHHDVEVMDASGRRLAKARLPEGVAGMARLHAIVGQTAGEEADEAELLVGIETDRGPWPGPSARRPGHAAYGSVPERRETRGRPPHARRAVPSASAARSCRATAQMQPSRSPDYG